jgi:hypothetical protein
MYLTEAQMAIIQEWADEKPQAEEVRLFGSYAKGTADAGSDVATGLHWPRSGTNTYPKPLVLRSMSAAPFQPAAGTVGFEQ